MKTEKTLTEDQAIEAVKAKLKSEGKKLYETVIDDIIYLWHPIKRSDYRRIDKEFAGSVFDKQEEVIKACVVYPLDLDELIEEYAGMPNTLSEEILAYSGWNVQSTTRV